MNSCERVVRRIQGEAVDRPPNFDIMMTFAAHHIGQPLSRYYLDHRVLGEANLAVQRAFDLDLVQTISDPFREAADLGADIEFPEDDLPICKSPLLEEPSDLGKLKAVDPYALRYLQYKFDNAIDEHEPVEKAWAASIAAFNIRKKQVPAREVFQGHILKIGQDAFLIKSVDDTVFYLMGCVTSGAQVGQPMLGYCWPMPDHPHSCKDEDGKSKTVKSFTLNLWWDY